MYLPDRLPPGRFFIDENMLGVAKALAYVRDDCVHPGHPDIPEIPTRALDSEWLPIVGERGWAVIMRDKKIRKRPGERERLLEHKVRAFCLTGSGNQRNWGMLELLVRNWPRIKERAAEPGPFIYAVTSAGIRRLEV